MPTKLVSNRRADSMRQVFCVRAKKRRGVAVILGSAFAATHLTTLRSLSVLRLEIDSVLAPLNDLSVVATNQALIETHLLHLGVVLRCGACLVEVDSFFNELHVPIGEDE